MTDPTHARTIAEGLSAAQRRAVMNIKPDYPVLWGRPRTLRKLAEMQLCQPPKDWAINRTHVLARPLGLAVRTHLEGKSHGE